MILSQNGAEFVGDTLCINSIGIPTSNGERPCYIINMENADYKY